MIKIIARLFVVVCSTMYYIQIKGGTSENFASGNAKFTFSGTISLYLTSIVIFVLKDNSISCNPLLIPGLLFFFVAIAQLVIPKSFFVATLRIKWIHVVLTLGFMVMSMVSIIVILSK